MKPRFLVPIFLALSTSMQWRATTRQLEAIAPPKKILNPVFTRLFIDFCKRIKIYTHSKSICTLATPDSESLIFVQIEFNYPDLQSNQVRVEKVADF
jgi:hypothetical protein